MLCLCLKVKLFIYSSQVINNFINFLLFNKVIIPESTRVTDDGETTIIICKAAPDICTSNPQAISYVDKTNLSHILPAYQNQQVVDPQFTFVDKVEPGIVDSQLSGFADKEGFMDSRILSDSRQNTVKFTEGKQIILNSQQYQQEPRYIEFCTGSRIEQQQSSPNVMVVSDSKNVNNYTDELRHNQFLVNAQMNCSHYNSLAGQTVPIVLKHSNQNIGTQSQSMYQNFGTLHPGGILRISEPGTSTSSNLNSNSNQRSMTLQNPKKKPQIGQNTFSTLECEKRGQRASGHAGKVGFYSGSAV